MAKFYYNGVLLPEIPADALANYPYAVILENVSSGNYELCLGSDVWRYSDNSVWFYNIRYITSYRYTAPIETHEDATEWELELFGEATEYTLDSRVVVWANHDIPNRDSTVNFYFYGSEPIPESGNDPSEPTTDILYTVNGSSLTAVANAIRAKKETMAVFTLEQMAAEIEGIVVGDDLPNAEEASFGVEGDKAYGILTMGTPSQVSISAHRIYGLKYTAMGALSILGLRLYPANTQNNTLRLWDANKQLVKKITVTSKVSAWNEYYFDAPINIDIGESFTIGTTFDAYQYYVPVSECTVNHKLTYETCYFATVDSDAYPSQMDAGNTNFFGIIDVIIGSLQAERPDTYQVNITTMDYIAEEVQRITGATEMLTPAQIIAKLSEVEVLEDYEEVAF